MLFIFSGLPGTGKSTLANALAERLGGVVLDKDTLRHQMFGPDGITFTTEQDDIVIDEMLNRAKAIFSRQPETLVCLDGRVFSRNSQLHHVIDFAESIPAPWLVIECVCSPETARSRLSADLGKHIAANRTPELYDEVRARFEPIPEPKRVINTDQPLEACIAQLLAVLPAK